jgi:hypothetical protein
VEFSEIHDKGFQCFVLDITTIPHHSYRVVHLHIQAAPDARKEPVIQVLNCIQPTCFIRDPILQSSTASRAPATSSALLYPGNQFNSPCSCQIFALAQIAPAAVLFPRYFSTSVITLSRYSTSSTFLHSFHQIRASLHFKQPEFKKPMSNSTIQR